MQTIRGQLRAARDWWMRLCTGDADDDPLGEENFRKRVLVMLGGGWLLAILFLTLITPQLVNFGPEGKLAANLLFFTTATGVLAGMLILRWSKSRTIALHILLMIFAGGFGASCFYLGGTQSPTYMLLLLAPMVAAIAGSTATSAFWGLAVLAFWSALLIAEQQGFEFTQVTRAENQRLAMLVVLAVMTLVVVATINIFAQVNKELRGALQTSNTELAHLSAHDQLTGLPNRRFYDQRCALALQRSADRNSMTGVMFMDIDKFKSINDTYGHGVGDKVLTAVALRLQEALRDTDLVARLSGDEFAAVLEDVHSPEELSRIAHKLCHAIEQPLTVRRQQIDFSISIGIAIFPTDGRQKHELEEQADKAMYYAKKRGIPVALASLEAKNAPYPTKRRERLG